MSNFRGLAHIGLFTESIEQSKEFYINNLGFKLDYEAKIDKPDNQWLKIAFISLNGLIIELIEPSDKSQVVKGKDGIIEHITIEVKNLEEIIKDLHLKGIEFETEEPIKLNNLFNGVQVIFFRGPSGERLELFEFLA
ncbi:MAG: lactoylglutathione lyase [Clostridia bacterium]|jgi:lactoylglutathione lyase|nr:lactoylglutathione lyase [Clostridiales bacterium]MDK2934255.1 lactoylglutathione lyase [Clostridiales bacterium]MDN5323029.1 lactoylglutathione lyase [Clostridia bacterium]